MEQHFGSSSSDLLPVPVRGGRNLTTAERADADLSDTIAGWGSDLEAAQRAGVPRDRVPGLGPEQLYPDVEQQLPRHRIHKSTEHARLTPVFGTSCPPRGASGALRDFAYSISEGRKERWVLLLMADRIDMVEGLAEDLVTLRPPNLLRETGWRASLRHEPGAFAVKAAVGLACVAAVAALARPGRGRT